MFYQKLARSWSDQGSLLCVGLDPGLDRLPAAVHGKDALYRFNREIIDATAAWACAFKPQIAYYAAIGAEGQLERTIAYIKQYYPHIPVILDAKRGDIGATAKMYARECFGRYGADAVTVNPYMGGDTLTPFLQYEDRGVIILCRTSNPGSGDIQEQSLAEGSVSTLVARLATEEWNANSNVGLVVGATYPEEMRSVREMVGTMPLLVPGIGAQGGELDAVLRAGLDHRGTGLLINASRSILYAGQGADFAAVAAEEARRLCNEINQIRKTLADEL